MKRKMPNAQRRTQNIEFKKETLNAQPRTANIGWTADGIRVSELPNSIYRATRDVWQYDLEDRLLNFAVNIVELTESFRLQGLGITLRASFCGAERRLCLTTARSKQQIRRLMNKSLRESAASTSPWLDRGDVPHRRSWPAM